MSDVNTEESYTIGLGFVPAKYLWRMFGWKEGIVTRLNKSKNSPGVCYITPVNTIIGLGMNNIPFLSACFYIMQNNALGSKPNQAVSRMIRQLGIDHYLSIMGSSAFCRSKYGMETLVPKGVGMTPVQNSFFYEFLVNRGHLKINEEASEKVLSMNRAYLMDAAQTKKYRTEKQTKQFFEKAGATKDIEEFLKSQFSNKVLDTLRKESDDMFSNYVVHSTKGQNFPEDMNKINCLMNKVLENFNENREYMKVDELCNILEICTGMTCYVPQNYAQIYLNPPGDDSKKRKLSGDDDDELEAGDNNETFEASKCPRITAVENVDVQPDIVCRQNEFVKAPPVSVDPIGDILHRLGNNPVAGGKEDNIEVNFSCDEQITDPSKDHPDGKEDNDEQVTDPSEDYSPIDSEVFEEMVETGGSIFSLDS